MKKMLTQTHNAYTPSKYKLAICIIFQNLEIQDSKLTLIY